MEVWPKDVNGWMSRELEIDHRYVDVLLAEVATSTSETTRRPSDPGSRNAIAVPRRCQEVQIRRAATVAPRSRRADIQNAASAKNGRI